MSFKNNLFENFDGHLKDKNQCKPVLEYFGCGADHQKNKIENFLNDDLKKEHFNHCHRIEEYFGCGPEHK